VGPFCWCFPRGKCPPRLGHATYATSQRKLDGMGRREEQRAPALLQAWVDMKSRKIAAKGRQERTSTPRGGFTEALAVIKARAMASKLGVNREGASPSDTTTSNTIMGAKQPPTSPRPKTEDSSEPIWKQHMVMAAKKRKGKATAQERQPTTSGVSALESNSTLGTALQGKKRLPKPRSSSQIDELVWSKAMLDAQAQVIDEYKINCDIEEYYSKMCHVGKPLLAEEVQRRTQAIYDYRAKKQIYRENRRKSD